MGRFDRRNLRERCIACLRDEIVSGALQPGEHIKEAHLSEKPGISRGALREALRSIENESLLVNDGKGHVRVRTLSAAEIADVFEVRNALEILAASKLARSSQREEFGEQLESKISPLRRQDRAYGGRRAGALLGVRRGLGR